MARRRKKPGLWWALVISLLINHGLILPGAYRLIMYRRPDPPADTVVEVALVPQKTDDLEVEPPRPKIPPKRVEKQIQRKLPRLEPVPPEQRKKAPQKPEQPKPTEPPKPLEPNVRLKMVEVQNPESDRPPENARFLSDKNRRVERETRARHTNLVKDHPKPEPRSDPNRRRDPDPGAKKQKVAELQEKQVERKKRERLEKKQKVPLLTMRPQTPLRERKQLAERSPDGELKLAQKARPRRRSQKPVRLNLDHKSHDRIYGKKSRKARRLARLSPSKPQGRHHRKWKRIRSALENFIPEVRPGNQTALGTRANPFALYIARMHRGIHKLWGYGFLVDLDNKPDRHPMNNMRLWTMIEVVVAPEGTVKKATIVRPSGILPYDVAALDTVFSAGPYPATPRAIRSADGNVYLHWRFHRNQRQCGTFGVDPFILTTPPKGPIDGNMAEVGTAAGQPRRVRRLNRPRRGGAAPPRARSHPAPPARSTAPTRSSGKNQTTAVTVARRFARAFQSGDAAKMAALCKLPFRAHGRKVASKRPQLRRMLGDMINEAGKQRRARLGRLMTPMEARNKLGRLPAGAEYGSGVLLAPVELGPTRAILLLQQTKSGWRVIGLNR